MGYKHFPGCAIGVSDNEGESINALWPILYDNGPKFI